MLCSCVYAAEVTTISGQRIQINSVDPVTGQVILTILPIALGPRATESANTTLYSATVVVNMTSISLDNATALLEEAGIDPMTVDVAGNYIMFTSYNLTAGSIARLRNMSIVISVSNPGA